MREWRTLQVSCREILLGASAFHFCFMSQSVDLGQLCIFIKMVLENMNPKEKLVCMSPLKGHIWSEYIIQAFVEFAIKTKLPLVKLISIATDVTPFMMGIIYQQPL